MARCGVRILGLMMIGLAWLSPAAPAYAQTPNKHAALIIDTASGTVLYEKHARATRHPASLTKIMTLYMLFEAMEEGRIHRSQRLKVSARAAGQPPSKIGVNAGETIRVEDAIRALVTKSANDIAVVVAEAIGGTEFKFGQMMTERARRLGMRNTTFRNASGLHDPRQVTTAYDMAMLGLAIRRDFPREYGYFTTSSFTWNGVTHRNHNRLLGHYAGTDGIKTGFINASGFNLLASVERDGRRLIGVVFGGRTGAARDQEMRRLLDSGFAKASDIRVARAMPPQPTPRPDRNVQRAAAEPVAVADGASLMAAMAATPTDIESGSTDAGSTDSGGDWGIQVGAYSTEIRAQRSIAAARGHLAELLTEAEASVELLERRTGPIYRARLFGLTEPDARTACVTLKRQHLPCVPVPGRNESALAVGGRDRG
jgi:D-alanyl-D-alanine carboxypeptidase